MSTKLKVHLTAAANAFLELLQSLVGYEVARASLQHVAVLCPIEAVTTATDNVKLEENEEADSAFHLENFRGSYLELTIIVASFLGILLKIFALWVDWLDAASLP